MSMEGSYTEFHIDFGGSSVWYHVIQGEKIFFMAPPTPHNLQLYRQWYGDPTRPTCQAQSAAWFLGEKLHHCFRYHLKPGETLLIPTGWIHAVYTPVDSIAFGGNFLHSLHLQLQLEIEALDEAMGLNRIYRYPRFPCVLWHVACVFYQCLQHRSPRALQSYEMLGLPALVETLQQWWQVVNACEESKREEIDVKGLETAQACATKVAVDHPLTLLHKLRNASQTQGKNEIFIRLPVGQLDMLELMAIAQ